MKSFYYNVDDAQFVDRNGEKIVRCVPELFYQERAVWRIMLRDRDNQMCDLSGIVAWGAAVDCDYRCDTAPMCRTLSEGIAADTANGGVTVTLDAATAEFFSAVNGGRSRSADFELYGLNSAGERDIYLAFEIRARMTLDPDPEVSPATPDTLATKAYVSAVMSSGAAAAGALMSGAEFSTTVGPYTVALTSGGGLAVSGSGASAVLSGGQIVASGANGESVVLSSGMARMHVFDESEEHQDITVDSDGVVISASGAGRRVLIAKGNNNLVTEDDGVFVNSRPVAPALVTSTDSETTSAYIEVLSGGISYVYTQPQYQVMVDSVAKTTEAGYLHFALDSVTAPVPVVVSGVSYLNSATFEGGREYLLRFFDGMMETHEVLAEIEQPVNSQTGVWLKSGTVTASSAMRVSGLSVASGETLYVYSRGAAANCNTEVTGAAINVYQGGIVTNADAAPGGVIVARSGGIVSGGTAGGVGYYIAYPGGALVNMVLSSGGSVFGYGGAVSGATVSSGARLRLQSSGSIANDIIIGHHGYLYVSEECSASAVSVASAANLLVSSGGTALAVTSNAGANVNVAEGGYIEYA